MEKQMDNYIQQRADINSFGKVIAIGDGVARVFGLSDAQAGETVFLFFHSFLKAEQPVKIFFSYNIKK